jgi:hypothetical protein
MPARLSTCQGKRIRFIDHVLLGSIVGDEAQRIIMDRLLN